MNIGMAKPTARYDVSGRFIGHEPRECGEHRTVGAHRAWCFDCQEWCYPHAPCVRCEIIGLRKRAAAHEPLQTEDGDTDAGAMSYLIGIAGWKL